MSSAIPNLSVRSREEDCDAFTELSGRYFGLSVQRRLSLKALLP